MPTPTAIPMPTPQTALAPVPGGRPGARPFSSDTMALGGDITNEFATYLVAALPSERAQAAAGQPAVAQSFQVVPTEKPLFGKQPEPARAGPADALPPAVPAAGLPPDRSLPPEPNSLGSNRPEPALNQHAQPSAQPATAQTSVAGGVPTETPATTASIRSGTATNEHPAAMGRGQLQGGLERPTTEVATPPDAPPAPPVPAASAPTPSPPEATPDVPAAPADRNAARPIAAAAAPAPDTAGPAPASVRHRAAASNATDRKPAGADRPTPEAAILPPLALPPVAIDTPHDGWQPHPQTATTAAPVPAVSDAPAGPAASGLAPLVPETHQPVVSHASSFPAPDPMAPAGPPPLLPVTAATTQADAPRSAPPPATEQLVPVLVSVFHDAAHVGHMTLQLQPDALGHVQIQIDRGPNQPMRIRIDAERPETALLLERDAPQLEHALDRAGIARDAMTVAFHTAPHVAPVAAEQDSGQTSWQFLGTGQPHQGSGGGRPPFDSRPTGASSFAPAASIEEAADAAPWARAGRTGLDIVA